MSDDAFIFDLGIQAMVAGDLAAVITIENQLYECPWTQQNFKDSLDSGYGAWVMIDSCGAVAGYAVLMSVVDQTHLLNISVAKPFQRRGYGGKLLGWLIEQSVLTNASGMLLEVRRSNIAALAMYRKIGFAIIGERKNYYPKAASSPAASSKREDAFVLVKAYGV